MLAIIHPTWFRFTCIMYSVLVLLSLGTRRGDEHDNEYHEHRILRLTDLSEPTFLLFPKILSQNSMQHGAYAWPLVLMFSCLHSLQAGQKKLHWSNFDIWWLGWFTRSQSVALLHASSWGWCWGCTEYTPPCRRYLIKWSCFVFAVVTYKLLRTMNAASHMFTYDVLITHLYTE